MCNGSDHVGQPIAMSLQSPPRTVSGFPFAMIEDMSMTCPRARVLYPGRPRHRPDQGDHHEGHQPSGLTRGVSACPSKRLRFRKGTCLLDQSVGVSLQNSGIIARQVARFQIEHDDGQGPMRAANHLRPTIDARSSAYRPATALLILKSSILLPERNCAASQRGCLPRPVQVCEG